MSISKAIKESLKIGRKEVIRIRKSKKVKQHNGQKKKYKRTNNTMVKRKSTKGQTTQWSKEKVQKDKQPSTK